MKKNVTALLLLLGMVLTIFACKKYEDDIGIFLRPPEKRLEGTWVEVNHEGPSREFEFKDDNTAIETVTSTDPATNSYQNFYSWELVDKKETLQLLVQTGSLKFPGAMEDYKLLRLGKKNLDWSIELTNPQGGTFNSFHEFKKE